MKTETINFTTAKGDTTAYVALPDETSDETDEPKKAVVIIHEYWGLNDHIKDIANRYAAEGFAAIAPDLYRGKIATSSEDADNFQNALSL